MNEHEWTDVWKLFCDLWPKQTAGMTAEEEAAYRRVMSRCRAGECIPALRGLKERSRFCPQPVDVRGALRGKAGHTETPTGATEVMSWPDQIRQMYRHAGIDAGELHRMSDQDIQVRYYREMAGRAREVYGEDSGSVGRFDHLAQQAETAGDVI